MSSTVGHLARSAPFLEYSQTVPSDTDMILLPSREDAGSYISENHSILLLK